MVIADNPQAQFPKLLPGERLGDPCPCGCGGLKVLPQKSTAKKLPILLPCVECKFERIYHKRGHHHQRCSACGARQRFTKENPSKRESGARLTLQNALRRKGIGIGKAERLAGIGTGYVNHWWVTGKKVPLRHSLQRLADVLEAPELMDVIPSLVSKITLICPVCEEERVLDAWQVRRWERRNHDATAVNWHLGTAIYPCGACAASQRMTGYIHKQIKNGMRKKMVARGKQLGTSLTPNQRKKALDAAHEANRGRVNSDEERRRKSSGSIQPYSAGKWGVCWVCRQLAYQSSVKVDGPLAVTVHRSCRRQWFADRRARGEAVKLEDSPTRPAGNLPSADDLAMTFAICVLHYLKGMPVGKQIGDGPRGSVFDGLAAEFAPLVPNSIWRRMKDFIDRLPTDGRGGRRLAIWSMRLREARSKESRPRTTTSIISTT